MAAQRISAELREFFTEEIRNDSNATLETALWHLRDFYERGPEDPVIAEVTSKMAETEELINVYDQHTPLRDLVRP